MEQKSLGSFIEDHKITVTSVYVGKMPMNPGENIMDKWNSTLSCEGREYTLPFFKGILHNQNPPTPIEILECLKSDVHSSREHKDVSSFAREYGFETGEMDFNAKYSKRDLAFLKENFAKDFSEYETTLSIFKAIKALEIPMTKFLGSDGLEELLNNVDLNIEYENPSIIKAKSLQKPSAPNDGPGY